MAKTGIIFILAGFVLLGAFVLDAVFVQPDRHLRQIHEPDNVHDDRLGGSGPDPMLYDPNYFDVTSERFMLNEEELRYAETGEDYSYVIQDGDTIDELAKKYLGHHDLKSMLFRENINLRRGEQLEPGTKITIPFRYRR